jgi:23S rRNA pseudouridine2605 synthase
VHIVGAKGKGAWLKVIMHEGKKREIREITRVLGLPVVQLIRVRIASLLLGAMKPGQARQLTPDEVSALKGAKTSNWAK